MLGEAVSELSDVRGLANLRLKLVQTVARELVSAEDGSFNEIDYERQEVQWVSIRPLPGESQRQSLAAQTLHAHPIVRVHLRSDAPAVLRVTDLMPQKTFERFPLYEGLYRPIGMRYMLTLRLTHGLRSQTMTLLRSERDFSDKEVKTLQAFVPLATMLIHAAADREHFAAALTAAAPDRGVIRLDDRNNAIVWANDCACRQLAEHFPTNPSSASSLLPTPIARWLKSPRKPFHYQSVKLRLTITLLQDANQRLLLVDEQPTEPTPDILQSLGLTPRQAEVLFWIARGKTNREIGGILNASVHTIHRHAEAIYQRLNVESRSAAMLCALEVPGMRSIV
jgi:DNA-binding CsgD family transcriptional regulator